MSRAEMAWRIKRLYYDRLNEDPDFQKDLSALFARLEELGVPPSSRATWEGALWVPPDIRPGIRKARRFWGRARASKLAMLWREVDGFVARWPLPESIWLDLDFSYDSHLFSEKPRGLPPQLEPGPSVMRLPRLGLPVVLVGPGVIWPPIPSHYPWIFPSHPLPFPYHPLKHDRRWLNDQIGAICREIRESILAQARVYDEAVEAQGWKPLGPRWRPGDLHDLVELLYLRAVKKRTWEDLADQANKAGHPDWDAETVRKRVTALARLIGLPL